jgi:hypothetical protein
MTAIGLTLSDLQIAHFWAKFISRGRELVNVRYLIG